MTRISYGAMIIAEKKIARLGTAAAALDEYLAQGGSWQSPIGQTLHNLDAIDRIGYDAWVALG